MHHLSVVILAAGQGKRMNSGLPKVLQPLAGQPLLKHVIRTAVELEPAHIYVVYGHGGAQVQAALAHEPVEWILQAEQLGTGHAVMQAMCVIPDDHTVLVLYGDVPLIRAATLKNLLALADEGALAILSVDLGDAAGYGRIVRGADGRVSAIVEHRDASPAELEIRELNSGLMAAPAGRLREWLLGLGNNNSQREYYLTDVVAGAVAAGERVEAVRCLHGSEVTGVNDRIQLAQVEALHRRARAEELMLAGATVADPARIDIRGDVEVGPDVFIDINAVFTGTVRLGRGVKIGPNCVIGDSVIGAGTEIHANSIIEHAVMGENCRVGPFARDARVGSGVNIGAGSITCNYDGQNKWPTEIGDGAFIGSGSMLVAPVRIGAGATIGAGSTIGQNAPDGKLTLARAHQTTVAGWTRPRKLDEDEKAAVIDAALARPKP
jgi:bifunctional UDP-N-acetylglucosamine pyrophosphorylase/glucosamine-1-phosphate N-acetyltransferase